MLAEVTIIYRATPEHEFPQARHLLEIQCEQELSDQALIEHFSREYPKAHEITVRRLAHA